jgi:hypothetical protein
LFTSIPLAACWRYEPREHLGPLAVARSSIPPSPLRDRVGYSDHDRFRGYVPVHCRSGLQPPCLRFAAAVTGRHARLGARLLARLYRGRHLRRLSSTRLQGATRADPDRPNSGIRLVWGFLCQGVSRHFCLPCHSILLFDPRREHSSAPTAYFHRRRAQRRSRTALLQRRRRLVLDGREHGGRLPATGGWPREDPRGACHWPRSIANHACIRLNPMGS